MNKTHLISSLILGLCSASAFASVSLLSSSQCQAMTSNNVMAPKAPVQCDRLRNVTFTHYNFEGKTATGKVVVLDAVAPYVDRIFNELYKKGFPIAQAQPIEQFGGDDNKSMDANNTSAFNYRPIAGKSSLSLHAYGVAVDINPLQNPFVEFTSWGTATFKPLKGHEYANRMLNRLGKKEQRGLAESAIATFTNNGFVYWGGYWDTPIDFQHFQTSRDMAYLMTDMPEKDASTFFKNYVGWVSSCQQNYGSEQMDTFLDYSAYLKTELNTTSSLNRLYKANPNAVIQAINKTAKASQTRCFG
ncbi:M15 family peptidase [Aliivibrio salmonicida]|uniref:Exported protein n=1 Tax=Aliivibrio salmonicida (strain LFI1238) TaxID=316275 RepID=B6EQP5_ALISL|nr:M15 family metallopeptidase [Aliivibrio salmonicida]AZL86444.1 M15 family peptidase [Aliivibrio salmonicida]CAQ81022.1 putative exported protein [Aliivibrio salmonicida LFI1238]